MIAEGVQPTLQSLIWLAAACSFLDFPSFSSPFLYPILTHAFCDFGFFVPPSLGLICCLLCLIHFLLKIRRLFLVPLSTNWGEGEGAVLFLSLAYRMALLL